MSVFASPELRILLAFAIGMLIGTERERRRAELTYTAFAGLRTFGLLGLLGGLFGYLELSALITVGAACVGVLALGAYVVNRDGVARGVTTEVAMLVTYALGVTAIRAPAVAASTGVLVASVLALRTPLHKAVREAISEAELRAGLLFLVFALVVLPLMPDVRVGPYGAIHPPSLARLVVLLMLVNGVGHVAQRVLGSRFGIPMAGFAGGFVSSSATIAAMSMRAGASPGIYRSASAAAIASCIATSVQYLMIVAAIDMALLRAALLPLGASLLTALVASGVLALRAPRGEMSPTQSESSFRPYVALLFVGVYVAVTVAATALNERFGATSVVLVSAAAGLIDAHSTAGSIASLHLAGELDTETALFACLTALTSNGLVKVGLAWSGRQLAFGWRTTLGVVATTTSAWLMLLVR